MNRREETEIRKSLALRRDSIELQLIVRLLEILLEQGKEQLVTTCTPENFPIVQGQARAYQQLLTMITRPMPDITPKAQE